MHLFKRNISSQTVLLCLFLAIHLSCRCYISGNLPESDMKIFPHPNCQGFYLPLLHHVANLKCKKCPAGLVYWSIQLTQYSFSGSGSRRVARLIFPPPIAYFYCIFPESIIDIGLLKVHPCLLFLVSLYVPIA